ncbi:hypothetical protein SAMN05428952_10689 [Nitrosomonas sp. Nm132]|jgi:hypothetical protein|nr:hypothetical protein SAMN05428952_10689 [Nitrosomonas sp. Nm132]
MKDEGVSLYCFIRRGPPPSEIIDLFALIQELDHTDSNFYKLLFKNNNIIAK